VAGAGVGTSTTVFIHQATADNIPVGIGYATVIDHPLTNGDPNAVLIITPNWNPGGSSPGIYNNHPIGVVYIQGKWRIFNQDNANLAVGAAFNVLVVKP
jgi:hypothetical protein